MPITFNDRRRPAAVGSIPAGDADMANADTVMVQALTTYYEGSEHKSTASPPYAAPRWQAKELEAQGFARIVDDGADEPARASETVEVPAAAVEPPAAPALPVDKPRRGRPPSNLRK